MTNIDTTALAGATAIMAILHDAVLNPGPGGLVQVKAKIQIAVREAIEAQLKVVQGVADANSDLLREKQGYRDQLGQLQRVLGAAEQTREAIMAERDELENLVLKIQDMLGIPRSSEDNPIADEETLLGTLGNLKRSLNNAATMRDAYGEVVQQVYEVLELPEYVHSGDDAIAAIKELQAAKSRLNVLLHMIKEEK